MSLSKQLVRCVLEQTKPIFEHAFCLQKVRLFNYGRVPEGFARFPGRAVEMICLRSVFLSSVRGSQLEDACSRLCRNGINAIICANWCSSAKRPCRLDGPNSR